MDFKEYCKKAQRTSNDKLTNWQKMQNGLTGIIGECGEIMEFIKKTKYMGHPFEWEKLEKELGDVWWYIAEFHTAYKLIYGIDIEPDKSEWKDHFIRDNNSMLSCIERELPVAMGKLLTMDVRSVYFEDSSANLQMSIYDALKRFIGDFGTVCSAFEPVNMIRQKNIQKLEKRYAEKFSTEASLGRKDE